MYGKIVIRCEMKVVTGLHIGASSAFSAIGAVLVISKHYIIIGIKIMSVIAVILPAFTQIRRSRPVIHRRRGGLIQIL